MKHCMSAGRIISSHWCFTAWTPAAPTMGHPRRGQSRRSFCLHLLGLQLSLFWCTKQGKVCLLGFAEPAARFAEAQEGHAISCCLMLWPSSVLTVLGLVSLLSNILRSPSSLSPL